MTKIKRRIVWLILVFAIGAAVVPWLYREIQIDKCLDAGGAWDYEGKHCIFEIPQK